MIKGYFGVPGCGKTTNLVKLALKEQKRKRKRYDHIYTINVDIKGCERITKEILEKYLIENSLILWDEITLDADNREYKTFSKELRDFFILHRHLGCDIVYVTQNYEKVDKVVRDLTGELWYMERTIIPILDQFTKSKRIYRNITINEHTSELSLGYRFCNLIESFFTSNVEITLRTKYYKYFDSYSLLSLESRTKYEKQKIDITINNND